MLMLIFKTPQFIESSLKNMERKGVPSRHDQYGIFCTRFQVTTTQPAIKSTKIWGRWATDFRISCACISRGFCLQEQIRFEAEVTHDHPYNLKTGKRYEAMGTAVIEVLFQEPNPEWREITVKVIDHTRLCTFDDHRLDDLENYQENPGEKPLWCDLILGAEGFDEKREHRGTKEELKKIKLLIRR